MDPTPPFDFPSAAANYVELLGCPVPLHDADGNVVACAYVDNADAALAAHRWWLTHNGYAQRTAMRGGRLVSLRLHREVLGLQVGDGKQSDHIDRDKLNCRRSNLRVATVAQNAQNRVHPNASSGERGVTWHARDKRWQAYGTVAGKRHHLGLHRDKDAAVQAARAFRAANMPFANEVSA